MKIEYLNYLREIEKCKSISAAAKKLYIGQTTLSAIIKSIEDELDVRLFHRLPNGVVPTEKGAEILRYSEEIVEKYREMLQFCQLDSNLEKRIHFLGDSTTCTFLSVYLTKTLQQLGSKESASIIFHEVERRKLVPSIIDGLANIGVTSLDSQVEVEPTLAQAERSGIEAIPLGIDRFYLCVRPDDPHFAGCTIVDVKQLAGLPFVAPQHYSAVANGTAFSEVFRQLHCAAVLPGVEFVKQAVAECPGMFTILTGRNLVNDPYILHGQLVAISLTGFGVPNSTSIYMFSKKRSSLNFFERAIYDALKEYGKRALSSMDYEDETVEPYPPLFDLQ